MDGFASTTRWAFALCASITLLSLQGCPDELPGRQLRVDLVTDFVPGTEFDAVRVSIGEGDIRDNFDHVVDPNRDYVRGVALGDLRVGGTEQNIEVLLFQDGVLVIGRQVSVIVQTAVTVATVVITRDCRGVMCPGDGNPLLASCLGGQCADPRCTVETPEFCPAGTCFNETDCSPPHLCAVASCVTGACLFDTDDSLCDDGERCDIELACVAADFDAGTPDTGTPDAGFPDASFPDVTLDTTPDAGPMTDAGPDIRDVPVIDVFDAGPPPGCPGVDADTLFLYNFQTNNDVVSGIVGAVAEDAERIAGTSPCGGRMLSVNGPTPGRFVVPDRAAFHLTEGSIDFWVRRPSDTGLLTGIVSRDAIDIDEPGHLTMFYSQDGRLALRGQISNSSSVILCSGAVPEGEWIRIGINFGSAGLEFYVNGVRQNAGGTATIFTSPSTCNTTTIPFSIAGTTNPFVLGASAHRSMNGSDEPASEVGPGWRYDHFRVSRVRRDYTTEL